MSADEMVGACLAAAVGLLVIATHGWDAWHKRRARHEEDLELDRWQQTAADAARRDESDVKADLAKARAALDLTTCLAIWNVTPHDIPHQTRKTRRTEEDQ